MSGTTFTVDPPNPGSTSTAAGTAAGLAGAAAAAAQNAPPSVVFIDLGRKTARQLRDLKTGHGPLAEAVLQVMANRRAAGANDEYVIVVCERRTRPRTTFW